jgi:ribosomal protein S18 acetylase RimI-like enzyme
MNTIRRLKAEDAEIFRALRHDALVTDPDTFVVTMDEHLARPLSWFVDRLTEDAVFAAFKERHEAVGMVGFTRMKPAREQHRGQVWTMYVHPSARGQGLARALLETVIEYARSEVEVLELIVVSTNISAVALYEKLGFKRWGLQPCALKLSDGHYTVDGYYYLPLKS